MGGFVEEKGARGVELGGWRGAPKDEQSCSKILGTCPHYKHTTAHGAFYKRISNGRATPPQGRSDPALYKISTIALHKISTLH